MKDFGFGREIQHSVVFSFMARVLFQYSFYLGGKIITIFSTLSAKAQNPNSYLSNKEAVSNEND
jgi:hypothetical protein